MEEKELCIIEKSKIYFFDFYDEEYKLFGTIDPIGIEFNIVSKMYGNKLEQHIPNPCIEFYIELGKKLEEVEE